MKAQTRNTRTIKVYVTGECAHFKVYRLVAGEVLSPYGEWLKRQWKNELAQFTTREAAETHIATL